jgi:hypothetical protein
MLALLFPKKITKPKEFLHISFTLPQKMLWQYAHLDFPQLWIVSPYKYLLRNLKLSNN